MNKVIQVRVSILSSSIMKKIILPFLLFLVFYSACSENPSNHDPESTDEISGVYFMHGKQINIRYDFPWPSWGGDVVILSRDTVETSFTIEIEIEEDRPDTLKFMGLPRASSSYTHTECLFASPHCAFAKKTGTNLEFNIPHPSGAYTAIGTIENGKITLDAHFEYRAIGNDYLLQGEKVEP